MGYLYLFTSEAGACVTLVAAEGARNKTSVPGRGQDTAETVQGVPVAPAGQNGVQGRAEGADEEDEGGAAAEDGDAVTAVRRQHLRDDRTTERTSLEHRSPRPLDSQYAGQPVVAKFYCLHAVADGI